MQLMHPKTSVSYQQWETCVSSKKGGKKALLFPLTLRKKHPSLLHLAKEMKNESKLFFKAAKETLSARDEPVASTKR